MNTLIHSANSRGRAQHDWLDSRHTFSFASYFNPDRMNFGTLRVLNDDVIAPASGFATHSHSNMEIISVPIYGSLRHKDSMGHEYVINKGEIQTMSAGSGVSHSEYNNSKTEKANFLQIWVLPKKLNITPSYDQKTYSEEGRKNSLQLIVSPDGRENSNKINQDAFFSLLDLDQENSVEIAKYIKSNGLYLFVISGKVEIKDAQLEVRDAMGLKEDDQLKIRAERDSELLIMEVPLQ